MTELRPHPIGIPLPQPNPYSKPYWNGCARNELLYQRCSSCQTALFNPTPICRACGSRDLQWDQSAGCGSVYSWSTVWRPQSPAFATPYVAAIVDVDEGFQILANIIGCEPQEIFAAMRVKVEFHPIGEGFSLPYFKPDTPS